MKYAGLLLFAVLLSGCVTAETLKRLPDEKLRYNQYIDAAELYRQEIVRRRPEWSEEIKQAILKGKALIGMTKEQALAAWGRPKKINRSITVYGVHEQWVYGIDIYNYGYLYFDSNILTSIQD